MCAGGWKEAGEWPVRQKQRQKMHRLRFTDVLFGQNRKNLYFARFYFDFFGNTLDKAPSIL